MGHPGLLPLFLLGAAQVIDAGVHLATDQVEPVRLISNGVILAGGALAARLPSRAAPVTLGAGLVYLALNLAFVAANGLTNPVTDAPRLPLLGFVAVSLGLLHLLKQRVSQTAAT